MLVENQGSVDVKHYKAYRATFGEGILQAIKIFKFNVTETFGFIVLVFDDFD